MLTQKALELREAIDKNPGRMADIIQSNDMFNELINNCNPTEKEFGEMTYGVIISGGDLYRIIVKIFNMSRKV